jgi:hypothetical protein
MEETMPKYVIERELPGAGSLSAQELQGISAKSNHVIGELGPEIRWLTSYVTDDKLYCIYSAPDEDILLEHARCGAFPANRISKVSAVIDPSTGDGATASA